MGDIYAVKLRGLPWTCTPEEILAFFDPIEVKGGCDGIHMPKTRDGRPTGEAFVEFETAEDVSAAEEKNNEHIGRRYIEVFRAKPAELEWVMRKEYANGENADQCCVRLRGLPYNCSKEEISNFFSGLEIVPNGIALEFDFNGRATGEAYVQFVSKGMAVKAQDRHKEKIGHRYIEIFPSTLEQVRQASRSSGGPPGPPPMGGGGGPFIGPQAGPFGGGPGPFNNMGFNGGGGGGGGGGMGGFNNRSAPYDARDRMGGPNRFNRGGRGFGDFDGPGVGGGGNFGGYRGGGGGGGRGGARGSRARFAKHSVHMRGLPFKAKEYDIMDFFKPLETVNIIIGTDNSGRPSGEADVEFASHEDAVKATEKHKAHMKHRYIELFLNSSPADDDDDDFNGGGRGNFGGNNFGMGGGGGGGTWGGNNNPSMAWGQSGGGGGGNMGFGGGMGGGNMGMGSNMGGNNMGSGFGNGGGGFGGGMGGGYGGGSRGGGMNDEFRGKMKATGRLGTYNADSDRRPGVGGNYGGAGVRSGSVNSDGFSSKNESRGGDFGGGYGSGDYSNRGYNSTGGNTSMGFSNFSATAAAGGGGAGFSSNWSAGAGGGSSGYGGYQSRDSNY